MRTPTCRTLSYSRLSMATEYDHSLRAIVTLNLATVNRRLTVIKHMFKKAVEWDLTKANPATAVKRFAITSERTRFLSRDEIQGLLKECEKQVTSPWLLPLVTLALSTGMRQGELLSLKWENVNL